MIRNYKVNYFSREFSSIKDDLTRYAKQYYPTTFNDLSEADITTFMIESVAYVGDILSYYLDFQSNEAFIDTATDPLNINRLAKSMGFKQPDTFTTSGKVTAFMLVPSDNNNSPDYTKVPVIKRGSVFSSIGGSKFLVADDIVIDENLIGINYTVAKTNNVGNPTYYAIKFFIPVISGVIQTERALVGDFKKFFTYSMSSPLTSEIISVIDSSGNEYYEVDNLSQNVVYKSVFASDTRDSRYKSYLKPISAQRRFVFDNSNGAATLTFGGSSISAIKNLTINPIAEPNKFIIQKYNNDFLENSSFEPNKLLNGDNFGVGPENTTLYITYRINSSPSNNVNVGELNTIDSLLYEFDKTVSLDNATTNTILNSFQIINDEAIMGDNLGLTTDEIKRFSTSLFQTQNRAVTAKDYEALCYSMSPKYGAIKRAKAVRDAKSLKNNINIYIVSVDNFDNLITSPSTIKQNLKNWLNDYKILTDTVDILDAKIINLKIVFTILADPRKNKVTVLQNARQRLIDYYGNKPDIGEPFNKLDIYRLLKDTDGVLDVKDLQIKNVTGAGYSSLAFNVEQNTTSDDNLIIIPKNAIYEIKDATTNILGNVI